MPATAPNDANRLSFGPEWVNRLFRDEPMPTAELRPVVCSKGQRTREKKVFPTATWEGRAVNPDSSLSISLRDIGLRLDHGDPRTRKLTKQVGGDLRQFDENLRPMARIYPWAPHELAVFDERVRFVTSAPDGLVKPDDFDKLPDDGEVKRRFAAANAKRMEELIEGNPGAVFIYTDGSRHEKGKSFDGKERCAGAFVVCHEPHPCGRKDIVVERFVAASPIGCVYSAELAAIEAALRYLKTKSAERLFDSSNGATRRVVLVTDSKSSLESVQTTWLRRIQYGEQTVARHLFDLASMPVPVSMTLAFVFSHAGGAPGNALADKAAEKAVRMVGDQWTDSLWNVDTTRRIQRNAHARIDTAIKDKGAFRFVNVPKAAGIGPSEALPRELTRRQEILLYRARLGMFASAGGMVHGVDDPCPLCEEDLLGRSGKTLCHLVDCIAGSTKPKLMININELWTDPVAAVKKLELLNEFVLSTAIGRDRAAHFQGRAGRISGRPQIRAASGQHSNVEVSRASASIRT